MWSNLHNINKNVKVNKLSTENEYDVNKVNIGSSVHILGFWTWV